LIDEGSLEKQLLLDLLEQLQPRGGDKTPDAGAAHLVRPFPSHLGLALLHRPVETSLPKNRSKK